MKLLAAANYEQQNERQKPPLDQFENLGGGD